MYVMIVMIFYLL